MSSQLPRPIKSVANSQVANPQKSVAQFALQRFGANLTDAIIFGALSAALVTAQMSVIMLRDPSVDINTVMLSGALAFALGFLDVVTMCGLVVYAAFIFGLLSFAPSSINWHQIFFLGLILPFNLIYHLVFEKSVSAATPGKRLFRLKLRGTAGEMPRLSKLVIRHLAKTLSALALLFPVLHFALGNRRQFIHDRIAGIYVHETHASDQEITTAQADLRKTALVELQCASLWRRVPAAILDSITFDCIFTIVLCVSYIAAAHLIPAPYNQTEAIIGYVVGAGLSSILAFAAPIVFMAGCESRLQTTPGKAVIGLVVTSVDLKRVSYREAIYKQLTQGIVYISLLPLFYLAAGSAMLIAPVQSEESLVFALSLALLMFGIYGLIICATFFKNRRTLLDVLCKRCVFVESKFRNHEMKALGADVSSEANRIQNWKHMKDGGIR